MASERLTKRDLAVLEKAFAAEIADWLPMQTRSKRAPQLVASGHLEEIERHLGGRFPVVVRGYALTQRGHLVYCESCKEDSDGE